MDSLQAIVYTSSAVWLLKQEEIDHLLERARTRNQKAGVSGLLLYCNGNFMQYIEGRESNLMPIYDIILADRLHHNIFELVNEPVTTREFAGWSMAYSVIESAELDKLLEQDWGSLDAARTPAARGHGRALLRRFWDNQMS